MTSTPTLTGSISPSSPSGLMSDESNRGTHLIHPPDEDIDLTIRPSRGPSPKAVKRHIISNTVTSCLSKFDSPEEVVWVAMSGSPDWSLSLRKANGKLSVDDWIDAHEFFQIINDPQTKNYKDILPFLLTRRIKFFQKRLWVLSTALEAMKGEWSAMEIPPSIDEEFSGFSSLVHGHGHYHGLSPTDVLICLAFEIQAHACARLEGAQVEKLVSNFHRMFESCHLLLRSHTILRATPRSRAAALKSALERLLPLSGGVDYLIKFSRHTFPDKGVRWSGI
ncbi:hypothetical protein AZE42_08602 [Rhizopogon vesiculosus]|uniref:Uncharacterized protein n=1 Tax=Rhizopogon vesiculosus TaxID=180088 RepID=A0A1J8QYM0_9AGAM|nr:hypothetical protein AZE42_08602 [Rhizopogon vesiculosus]